MRRTIWAYCFFLFFLFFLSFSPRCLAWSMWWRLTVTTWCSSWLPCSSWPSVSRLVLTWSVCARTRVCVHVHVWCEWCMLNEKQDGTGSWDLCTGCSEMNCSLCLMSSSDPVWLTGHFQLFAGCSISWHGLGLVSLILTSGGVWIASMILMCWSHSLPC